MKKTISILICTAMLLLSACHSGDKLNIIDDKYRNYYEVFVYSFCDSDGDRIGDLQGLRSQLPYIKDMGFNGLYLMPVMSAGTYHKYDVIDYLSIDKEYGTMEDMTALIESAHKNDIHVIIDFVINHTSSQNEWFVKATQYLRTLDKGKEPSEEECQYFGYYNFSKERYDNTWYKVTGTDWYYEGSFWSEMPDLNFESEYLKKDLEDIAAFWVNDMHVDGFRMDATMHFIENNTERNCEIMNELYEYCQSINPDFYMVSEVWASEGTIASYYDSRTDSLFNFDAADAEGKIIKTARGNTKASKFVNSMLSYEQDFAEHYPEYVDAVFITNHDMGRVSNALNGDEDAVKFAGGLMLSMNGASYVYYGEEIGMASKGTKDENKRLPMRWGDESKETIGPKDADKDIEQKFSTVKEQQKDDLSILNYYKKALKIRNTYPEIARGNITIVDSLTEDNKACIIKEYAGEKIAILYNNSKDTPMEFNLEGTALADMNVKEYLTVDGFKISKKGQTVILSPRSIVYMK